MKKFWKFIKWSQLTRKKFKNMTCLVILIYRVLIVRKNSSLIHQVEGNIATQTYTHCWDFFLFQHTVNMGPNNLSSIILVSSFRKKPLFSLVRFLAISFWSLNFLWRLIYYLLITKNWSIQISYVLCSKYL